MNHEQTISKLKEEKKEKFNNMITKTIMYIVIGGVILFFYRGFTDKDYERGHAWEKLGEILIDTAILQVVVLAVAIIFLKLFLNSHYASMERKIRASQQEAIAKIQAREKEKLLLKERLMQLIKNMEGNSSFPVSMKIRSQQSDLSQKLNQTISFQNKYVLNDEAERLLKKNINGLSLQFNLPQSFEHSISLKDEITRGNVLYPDVFNELFNEFTTRQNIPIAFLNHKSRYIAHYNNALPKIKEEYEKSLKIIESGNRGEERVNKELDYFNDFGKTLSNVRMEVNGQSVETDNIFLSTKGIFFFEVKNFAEGGSYSLRISKDGQWQRVYPNGNIVPFEKDVTAQHNRHLYFKGQLLRAEWKKRFGTDMPSVDFHPVIVIANDKVMIENETDIPIIRISQIYHHIQKFNDQLPLNVVDSIEKIIADNQLPLKKYPIPDYSNSLEEYRNSLLLLQEMDAELTTFIQSFLNQAGNLSNKNKQVS